MTAGQAMRLAASLALPIAILAACGAHSIVLWIGAVVVGVALSVLVETLWLIYADEAEAASDRSRSELRLSTASRNLSGGNQNS